MQPTLTACRLEAAEAAAVVTTDLPSVTDWVTRYFTPWWDVRVGEVDTANPAGTTSTSTRAPVTVHAAVRPDAHAAWTEQVFSAEPAGIDYVKQRTFTRRADDGSLLVVTPEEQLAYRVAPGLIEIAGLRPEALRIPAARVARAVVWGGLERAGWTLLHASALVGRDRSVLSFGAKGAGKTTTALLGARRLGLRLLANDRVFARVEDGRVRLITWAAVTSVGLGLLDGLGLYDDVRARLLGGEEFHPAQHPSVVAALRADSRRPVHDDTGREMKLLVAPDRLRTWLGVEPVGTAELGMVLFPAVAEGASAALGRHTYRIGGSDMFTEATEDSYPDVFGLRRAPAGVRERARDTLLSALAGYPAGAVRLGYRLEDNVPVLAHALAPIR